MAKVGVKKIRLNHRVIGRFLKDKKSIYPLIMPTAETLKEKLQSAGFDDAKIEKKLSNDKRRAALDVISKNFLGRIDGSGLRGGKAETEKRRRVYEAILSMGAKRGKRTWAMRKAASDKRKAKLAKAKRLQERRRK